LLLGALVRNQPGSFFRASHEHALAQLNVQPLSRKVPARSSFLFTAKPRRTRLKFVLAPNVCTPISLLASNCVAAIVPFAHLFLSEHHDLLTRAVHVRIFYSREGNIRLTKTLHWWHLNFAQALLTRLHGRVTCIIPHRCHRHHKSFWTFSLAPACLRVRNNGPNTTSYRGGVNYRSFKLAHG
jgi:hypothetical protein